MMGVLLIGESNSGKTHYGAQLLGRLQMRRGALRMIGAPSLGAYQAALQRLNNGLAAEHTAQAVYADSAVLSLRRWKTARLLERGRLSTNSGVHLEQALA